MAFSQLTGNVTLIGDPLTVDATWDCDGFQGTIRFHPKDDEVMTDRWKVYVDTREGRPQLVQCVKEAVQRHKTRFESRSVQSSTDCSTNGSAKNN